MQLFVSLAALLAQNATPVQITYEYWVWVDPEQSFTCSNLQASESVLPPQVLAVIEPRYPFTHSPIIGRCTVGFDVTPEGLPDRIAPTDCPDPRTVRGSVRTVERLRFSPARAEGEFVRCEDAQITYLWGPGVERLNEVEDIDLVGAPSPLRGGQPCDHDDEHRETEPPQLLSLPQPTPYRVDLSSNEGRCMINLDVDADGAPFNISEPDCIVPGLREAVRQAVFISAMQGPRAIAWCGASLEYDLTRGD